MSSYLLGDNIAEKYLHTEVQRVAGIKVMILFETIYLIACYIEVTTEVPHWNGQ